MVSPSTTLISIPFQEVIFSTSGKETTTHNHFIEHHYQLSRPPPLECLINEAHFIPDFITNKRISNKTNNKTSVVPIYPNTSTVTHTLKEQSFLLWSLTSKLIGRWSHQNQQ